MPVNPAGYSLCDPPRQSWTKVTCALSKGGGRWWEKWSWLRNLVRKATKKQPSLLPAAAFYI